MKNNLKIQLSAVTLGVIVTTALVAGTTYAQSNREGNFLGLEKHFQASNENSENFRPSQGPLFNEEIRTAIENNDYNAWVEAHGDNVDSSLLTEDRFNDMIERYNTREVGELLCGEERPGMGHGGMMNEAVREAIENNDYNAWVEAHNDNVDPEILTEDRFNKMIEIHEMLEDGDKEGAQELMEEVGFHGRGGVKGGRFMKKQAK